MPSNALFLLNGTSKDGAHAPLFQTLFRVSVGGLTKKIEQFGGQKPREVSHNGGCSERMDLILRLARKWLQVSFILFMILGRVQGSDTCLFCRSSIGWPIS